MGLSRGESKSREKERAAWYLAGLFDGEDCVSFKAGIRGLTRKSVQIDNTDLSIMRTACHAFDTLGIPYKMRGPIYLRQERWAPYYTIRLSSYDAIEQFAALVPFQSISKREKINVVVSSPRRLHDGMAEEIRK